MEVVFTHTVAECISKYLITTVPNNARHNIHIWVAKDLKFQKSSRDIATNIVFAFFINLNSILFKLVNKGIQKMYEL